MTKRKKQPIVHEIKVRQIKKYSALTFVEVHNRNTPLFNYNRAKANINSDIKAMKRDIKRARLLKVQAYIVYRLTK